MYTKIIIEDYFDTLDKNKKESYQTELNRLQIKKEQEFGVINKSDFTKSKEEKDLLKRSKVRWIKEMNEDYDNWTKKSDFYLKKIIL